MSAVFPHRTLAGPLELRLGSPWVDGYERPELAESHLARMDLSGRGDPEWRKLWLEAEVAAPAGEIGELLDDGIDPRALLVVDCSATNLRLGAALHEVDSDEASWSGQLDLAADD